MNNSGYVVPLNVGFVAAHAAAVHGDDIEIQVFKYPGDLVTAIKLRKPDVLGFSNYDWNLNLNRAVGEMYKEEHPAGILVMGGPNIRTDREGIARFLENHDYLDAYAMFQGEIPFANLIGHILETSGFDRSADLPGMAYFGPDSELKFEEIPATAKQINLASPYLTGVLDEFLGGDLIPLLETNRGCPYKCTFCTWGISAMDRVAYHDIGKVYEEFDYVCERSPKAHTWILADANFGIVKRDIEIAEHLGQIKMRNSALKHVVLWDAKNSGVRNLEVAKHVGDNQRKLVGLQSLDPKVLKAIKRSNIKISELMMTVDAFKREGFDSHTDILVGLPAETRDSHVNTLRKCFNFGFDLIDAKQVILLAGSDMETDESRETYGLRGKYRLKQGSYGIYGGVSAFEYEECILSTNTISEDEMHEMRMLHWLVWWGWNSGSIKPLLKFMQERGLNPVDLLVQIIHGDKAKYPTVAKMFADFIEDSRGEWFDTEEEIREYYSNPDNLAEMLDINTTYSKLVFKYSSKLVVDWELYNDFLDWIGDASVALLEEDEDIVALREIVSAIKELRLDADDARLSSIPTKQLRIENPEAAKHLMGGAPQSSPLDLVLYVKSHRHAVIQRGYEQFDIDNFQRLTIEKILEYDFHAFTYDITTPETTAT